MAYITSATVYPNPGCAPTTMSVIASGGDVTVEADVNGSYVALATVTVGDPKVIEFGRMSSALRVTPTSGADVTVI